MRSQYILFSEVELTLSGMLVLNNVQINMNSVPFKWKVLNLKWKMLNLKWKMLILKCKWYILQPNASFLSDDRYVLLHTLLNVKLCCAHSHSTLFQAVLCITRAVNESIRQCRLVTNSFNNRWGKTKNLPSMMSAK